MNQNESATSPHHGANLAPSRMVRRDAGADARATVLRDLRSDEANPEDVEIAMLPGEAQFARKVFSDSVSVQEGHAAPQLFESVPQRIRRRGFPSARQARKEDCEALCSHRTGAGGVFWTTPFSEGRKSVKFSTPVSVTTTVSS